jgi:hypothetical protein
LYQHFAGCNFLLNYFQEVDKLRFVTTATQSQAQRKKIPVPLYKIRDPDSWSGDYIHFVGEIPKIIMSAMGELK